MSERTPTETVINVLETFGEDEPRAVIIIYTTEGGDLVWSISDQHYTPYIGMCETVAYILKDRVKNMVAPKNE